MSVISVLQVLPEVDPGGAERVVLMVARHVPRERFAVSVAALDGRGPLGEEFRKLGCTVHDLGLRGRWSFGAARRLRRLIREVRPAIVHSHLLRAHLATAWALRGFASGGRHRQTAAPEDPDVCWAPAWVATEHQADPRGWALRVLRWAARRAAVVTAVSEGVRQHLIAHGFQAEKVVTIPNGVEVGPIEAATAIPRRELGLPDDARVAIFVGRLARQKGLDVLLRAMAEIACDPPALHLLAVGEGPDRAKLERLARRLGLAERVHFLGRRGDVPRLLKSADLCVIPSRWEGLSLVLLEAMAAGVPMVATRVAGSEEVIEHEKNGLLVPPKDARAMADAMRGVLDDPRRAREWAAGTRRIAHTAEIIAERYGHIYEDLARGFAEGNA